MNAFVRGGTSRLGKNIAKREKKEVSYYSEKRKGSGRSPFFLN